MTRLFVYDHPMFGEDERMTADAVYKFVEKEINPYAAGWEVSKIPKDLFKKAGQMDFFGIRSSPDYGGLGLGIPASIAFWLELGRSKSSSAAMDLTVQSDMSFKYLEKHGSEDLKEKYLRDIIKGNLVCAIAITEPSVAGSDVANIELRAEKRNTVYVLTGAKHFITNGPIADLYFVAARTDPYAEKPHEGISIILVERNTTGFEVREMGPKMGMRASNTGVLSFDGCEVPRENLIGVENKGFKYLMSGLEVERLAGSALVIGSACQAIEDTLVAIDKMTLKEKKLTEYQGLMHPLAMHKTYVDAAIQLLYRAAQATENPSASREEKSMYTAECKVMCPTTAQNAIDYCIQLLGAMGYMVETGLEVRLRDARLWRIGAGTDEVQKDIISKLLKKSV